jgi:hypothetical protein
MSDPGNYLIHETLSLEERALLHTALNNAIVALNTWTNIHAPDMCKDVYVREAHERVMRNGGTLAFIADTVSQCVNARKLLE